MSLFENQFVAFALILFLVIAPIAVLLLKLIFRNSIIFRFGLYATPPILIIVYLSYIVGATELRSLIWAAPLGIVANISLYWFISLAIQSPLKLFSDKIKELSEGNIDVKVDESFKIRKDEFGMIARSLDDMLEKLTEITSSIIASADNVRVASQELNTNSQQLSQSASEQASSAEEVSSSMEEMASSVEQNTANAKETEKIANKISGNLGDLSTSSKDSLEAIQTIANRISIINDIAYQTNILALNASVEAARAGEYGRGFSVVAAEVRKLSEQSKKAADEIGRLSTSSVDITYRTRKLLEEMLPDMESIITMVREVSAASIEQSSSGDQINDTIQQLNQIAQENAASSEEMATSSEELDAQAQQLYKVIRFFKVNEDLLDKMREKFTEESNKMAHNRKGKTYTNQQRKGFTYDLSDSDELDQEYEKY